jgi:hypothetical protein
MLRTTDGGATWEQVIIGTHQNQNVVYFFTAEEMSVSQKIIKGK